MANELKGLVDITTGVEKNDANDTGLFDLTEGQVSGMLSIEHVTKAERDALTPATGTIVYVTDRGYFSVYDTAYLPDWSCFGYQNNGDVKVNGYDTGSGATKPSWSLSADTEQEIVYPSGSSLIISSATYWPRNQTETDSNFYNLNDEASVTASTIAFNDNGGSPDTIVRSSGSFITDGFTADRPITISGSTSNNTNNEKSKGNIEADTIAFVSGSPDTITDSDSNFLNKDFIAGSSCVVTGSPANSGLHRIVSVTAGTLTLDTNTALTNESAGTNIVIKSVKKYIARTVTASTITLDPADSLKTESAGATIEAKIPTKNKFLENDVNLQHNSFRILSNYVRSSASATEEILIILRNPLSDFIQAQSRVIPKGILNGNLSFELNTIADNISIYNGYTFDILATQAMTFAIDSITRFSQHQAERVPIIF